MLILFGDDKININRSIINRSDDKLDQCNGRDDNVQYWPPVHNFFDGKRSQQLGYPEVNKLFTDPICA